MQGHGKYLNKIFNSKTTNWNTFKANKGLMAEAGLQILKKTEQSIMMHASL